MSFSKFVQSALFLLGAAFASPMVFAAEAKGDWLDYSLQIMKEAEKQPTPAWMTPQMDEETARQAQQLFRKAAPIVSHAPSGLAGKGGANFSLGSQKLWELQQPTFFVSFGMPKEVLKEVAEEARDRKGVLVFRGVMPGGKLNDIAQRLSKILGGFDKIPQTMLDPTVFVKYGVSAVPTFMFPRGDVKPPLLVRGAAPTDKWLATKRDSVQTAFNNGQTYDIAEADLIEEMKRRMAKIDWDQKRKNAYEHFWSSMKFVELPEAKQTKAFEFDPSVISQTDIRGQDGRMFIRAGDKINPLEFVTMTKRYMFFDGTRKHDLDVAKKYAAEARAKGEGLVLIMAKFDNSIDGGKEMDRINQYVHQHVYFLSEQLAQRFRLRALPSVAQANGKKMRITELGPEQ